jgi:hypothetical protein
MVGKPMVPQSVRNAAQDNINWNMEVRFVFRALLVRMPLSVDKLNARRVPSIGIQIKVGYRNARFVKQGKRQWYWAKPFVPNATRGSTCWIKVAPVARVVGQVCMGK